MSTNGKVAIVTGGGTGVGKRTVLALLREGYSVALAGRRMKPLERTLSEGKSFGSQGLIVATDVREPSSVADLFARTNEKFGRLDLLFNNAGVSGPPELLEDLTYDQWRTVVDINLTGTFLCIQEAFKLMKNQILLT